MNQHKLILLFLISAFWVAKASSSNPNQKTVLEWFPAELIHSDDQQINILGNPQIITGKYGKAVRFNGETDGIFLNQMPLAGLDQFSVEVIFCPESGGNFEQRFFHCGEIRGDRVLLELRSTPGGWYLDAFINSRDQKETLIDPGFLHPFGQWYHVAYIVDHGKLTTYVNGKKEMEGQIVLTPLQTGKTSLGVRQNQQSWFKGTLYEIRITGKALSPKEFLVGER